MIGWRDIMVKLLNISPNFHKIIIHDTVIWFSYETPIGFGVTCFHPNSVWIAKNQWSKTTAKHINKIKEEVQYYKEVDYDYLLEIVSKHS